MAVFWPIMASFLVFDQASDWLCLSPWHLFWGKVCSSHQVWGIMTKNEMELPYSEMIMKSQLQPISCTSAPLSQSAATWRTDKNHFQSSWHLQIWPQQCTYRVTFICQILDFHVHQNLIEEASREGCLPPPHTGFHLWKKESNREMKITWNSFS